jgi:REP element-mobilizing transposase RayT
MKSKFDQERHHRRSIRIPGYDYSQAGWYFITICVDDRECVFGSIKQGIMVLNEFGQIVVEEWLNTAELRDNVLLDAYTIMPNHFHSIINIIDDGRGMGSRGKARVGAYCDTPLQGGKFQSPSGNLGSIIRGFKSAVTKRINRLRNTPGLPVWQRNYFEHIIRDEEELNRIRRYIIENPMKWSDDRYFTM